MFGAAEDPTENIKYINLTTHRDRNQVQKGGPRFKFWAVLKSPLVRPATVYVFLLSRPGLVSAATVSNRCWMSRVFIRSRQQSIPLKMMMERNLGSTR